MKSYAPSEKSGGGTLRKTTLWTNPSPSNSFGGQGVTLSDNISNYDYIEIEWAESRSAQTNKSSMFFIASEFSKYKDLNNNAHVVAPGIYGRLTTYAYVRFIAWTSDTQIYFSDAVRVNSSGFDNAAALPLNIYGVKM